MFSTLSVDVAFVWIQSYAPSTFNITLENEANKSVDEITWI